MTRQPTRLRRACASILDRLIDADPDRAQDRPKTVSETIDDLKAAVLRDIEHLLNARRPWRSVPRATLKTSSLGYGIPDFTAGAFDGEEAQEALRAEIEDTILRFEPRLTQVQVQLAGPAAPLRAMLTLNISALVLMEPAPEPINFDTFVDTTTSDVVLRLTSQV